MKNKRMVKERQQSQARKTEGEKAGKVNVGESVTRNSPLPTVAVQSRPTPPPATNRLRIVCVRLILQGLDAIVRIRPMIVR